MDGTGSRTATFQLVGLLKDGKNIFRFIIVNTDRLSGFIKFVRFIKKRINTKKKKDKQCDVIA